MADPAILVLGAFAAGVLGGILSSAIGYLSTATGVLDRRKFIVALITGAGAGFGIGITAASQETFLNAPFTAQLIVLAMTFTSAMGIDFVRNRIGDMQAIAAKK